MAVTKIKPIKNTIHKSIEYIINPDKTEQCKFVHSENCFPETAAIEFEIYLKRAQEGGKVIGRHLIQSFAVGETTPEQAHEIGKKLAREILGGHYAYVMSTHMDRNHIHNHFVWCAVNLETNKRYVSNKNSYHKIQQTSDKICREFGLSVIEKPQSRGKSYAVYVEEKNIKSQMRKSVDKIIENSKTYEEFLKAIKQNKYDLEFIKSLGYDYKESVIKQRIYDNRSILKRLAKYEADIKNVKNAEGYNQWAKIQNLKRMSQTIIVMQDNGINYENIDSKCSEAAEKVKQLRENLRITEREIKNSKPDDLPRLYDLLNEQSRQYYTEKRKRQQFDIVRKNIIDFKNYNSSLTLKIEKNRNSFER